MEAENQNSLNPLELLDRANQAKPNPFLFRKIMDKLEDDSRSSGFSLRELIKPTWVKVALAYTTINAIVILSSISLNGVTEIQDDYFYDAAYSYIDWEDDGIFQD